MKRWPTIIRERYKVISDIGIDGLKDIIERKESGMGYWDAVHSHYVEWVNGTSTASKRTKRVVREMKI